ncbi:MAG: amino acid-binding protein [Phycisphaerales bacterium]|nr:amino acid-binding protein [Phycisphaerales bacterium]MCB9854163.1 amino acid-binding protein [Phycisphaerales bacterium]MCB9864701.1 amino acid-binding protein [Phycisphaerales bacterium]
MAAKIESIDVWAGDLLNRPERLARVLEALASAGAELEFLVARRVSDRTSRVYVAPLKGKKQKQAAADVGLVRADGMFALRIVGSDRPGLGAEITRCVAAAGINIRGASAASIGKKNAFYLGFRTDDERKLALSALRKRFGKRAKS